MFIVSYVKVAEALKIIGQIDVTSPYNESLAPQLHHLYCKLDMRCFTDLGFLDAYWPSKTLSNPSVENNRLRRK